MKKILFSLLLSILVVGAALLIYLKSHPPLVINGYTSFDDQSNVRLINIENTGFRELQLQNIVVNDGRPDRAELVISKAAKFEIVEGNDPNITYHGIKQVKLLPSRYIDRQALGKQPQHYAIKVEAKEIQTIAIHYQYLNIPFTLKAELKTLE